jgi:hypothetical protein
VGTHRSLGPRGVSGHCPVTDRHRPVTGRQVAALGERGTIMLEQERVVQRFDDDDGQHGGRQC